MAHGHQDFQQICERMDGIPFNMTVVSFLVVKAAACRRKIRGRQRLMASVRYCQHDGLVVQQLSDVGLCHVVFGVELAACVDVFDLFAFVGFESEFDSFEADVERILVMEPMNPPAATAAF